jgi:hypothetical protein
MARFSVASIDVLVKGGMGFRAAIEYGIGYLGGCIVAVIGTVENAE